MKMATLSKSRWSKAKLNQFFTINVMQSALFLALMRIIFKNKADSLTDVQRDNYFSPMIASSISVMYRVNCSMH